MVGSAVSKYSAMYGAAEFAADAIFSAGTVRSPATAGLAGRPAPAPTICFCAAGLVRNWRNVAQAGSAAPVVQE